GVMRETLERLARIYGAASVVLVPGGGTFAMESVARAFAAGTRALVVQNGYFSYRWSQILEAAKLPASLHVERAEMLAPSDVQSAFRPPPIERVCAKIAELRPQIVFAPHVETSAGIVLPDGYLRAIA